MFKRIGPIFVILLAGWTSAVFADDAPAASPTGFSAQGTLVGQTLIGGLKLNLGGDIALMSRGSQLRVDISHLSVPGSDPTMNALVAQFLPQGGFSVVLDRSAGTTTIWSAEKKKYYVMTPKNAAAAAPAAAAPSGGSIMQALAFAKTLKDYAVFDFATNLSGHGSVNGHPATTLHYAVRSQKRGEALSTMSGDLSLADDELGLPVRVTSRLKGKNFDGSFRLDFQTLNASAPNVSSFAVPDGFVKANDLSEIFSMPH